MKTSKGNRFLLALVFWVSSSVALAANWDGKEPSKSSISPVLYNMLETMRKTTDDSQTYIQAEQIYRYCNAHSNLMNADYVKAEALVVMCTLGQTTELDSIKNYFRTCQKLAARTKILDHYFKPWFGLIQKYVSLNLSSFAITESQAMIQEAIENNYDIGIAYGYQAYGIVLHRHREEAKSIKYLKQAVEIMKKNYDKKNPDNFVCDNLFGCYDMICSNYINIKDYKAARKYCLMSKDYARTERNTFLLYIRLCSVYALTNDAKNAQKYIDKAKTYLNRHPDMIGRYFLALAYYYYDIHDYKRALQYCDSCELHNYSPMYCLPRVYEAMGDFKNAYYANKRIIDHTYTTQNDINSSNFDEFSLMIDQDKRNIQQFSTQVDSQRSLIIVLTVLLAGFFFIFSIASIYTYIVIIRNRKRTMEHSKLYQKHQMLQQNYQSLDYKYKQLLQENKRGRELLSNLYDIMYEPLTTLQKKIIDLRKMNLSAEELETARKEADSSIDDVLDTTLTFTEIRAYMTDQVNTAPSTISLNNLLQEIDDIILTRYRARSKNQFVINYGDNTDLFIHKDSVVKILGVFIDNADKFTMRGTVTIGAKIDRKKVTISVTDTGIGIDSESGSKVFDLFYKAKKHYPGHGLGLYLARIISEKIGCPVDYDRAKTDGTCMMITIPANNKKKE